MQHIYELKVVPNEKKIQVALISETHLTKTSTLKILGFDIIGADHPDGTAHGGAALLVSNKIDHAPLPPFLSRKLLNKNKLLNYFHLFMLLPPRKTFPFGRTQ